MWLKSYGSPSNPKAAASRVPRVWDGFAGKLMPSSASWLGLPWEWEVRLCLVWTLRNSLLPCPALLSCALVTGSCLLQLPAPSTGPWEQLPSVQAQPSPNLPSLFQTPFLHLSLSTRCFPKCALFVLVSFSAQSPVMLVTLSPVFSLISSGQSSQLTLSFLLVPVCPSWVYKHLLSPFRWELSK